MNKYSDISNRIGFKSLSPRNYLKNGLLGHYCNSPEPTDLDSFFLCNSPSLGQIIHTKNEKVKELSNPHTISLPLLPTRSAKFCDFSTLIHKLDKITSKKVKHSHIVLKRNEIIKITQKSQENQYFKMNCKGSKCPLQVKIKIFAGQIISFAAFNQQYPSADASDKECGLSYFEISDNNYFFKAENIFLNVFAAVDSEYTIGISYGKVKTLSELRKNRQKALKNIVFIESDEEEIEIQKSPKDFVKQNLQRLNCSKSPEANGWEFKQKQVLTRKKQILTEKKQKAITNLKKNIISRGAKEILQRKLEENNFAKKVQKNILALALFLRSCEQIKDLIVSKRRKTLKKITMVSKVRKIKKFYTKTIKHPRETFVFSIAFQSLQLYSQLIKDFTLLNLRKSLFSMISSTAHADFLPHNFRKFFKKVRLIQKSWSDYKDKKRNRLKYLSKHWDLCLEKDLFNKKSRSLRKHSMDQYISIPRHIRDLVLNQYYDQKLKLFQQEIRTFHLRSPLRFVLHISDLEMEKIIKSSVG